MLYIDAHICLVLTLAGGGRGEWLRHLDHCQACVRPILSSIPQFPVDKRGWVDTWAILHPSPTFPVWADVFRGPMQWPPRRLPWHASAWQAGAGGSAFVLGLVREHIEFWDEVVLQEHPLRAELISCRCSEHGTSSTVVPYTLRRTLLLLQGALIE